MKYEGYIIRPPSEAYSLLLQVTVGCSHNKCTFCNAYKAKKFRIKSIDEIKEDILEAKRYGVIRRVFLCDGDALIIPQKKLLAIFKLIKEHLNGVERIGTYANTKSILRKSPEDLLELKELGLGIVYLGVESGNEDILKKIRKGVTYKQMVDAGEMIKEAGIPLSATVILGVGGKSMSKIHAKDTARILSDIDPDYVGALTIMIMPETSLYDDYIAGRFQIPDQYGFLEELGIIVANSNFTKCFFTSNHASNYLSIKAQLPQEKEKTVHLIYSVIESRNKKMLRPEFMRGL